MRQKIFPYIFTPDVKSILVKSMVLLALSKSLTIASPFFLKIAVNALGAPGADFSIQLALGGIFAYGGSRFISTLISELRMN